MYPGIGALSENAPGDDANVGAQFVLGRQSFGRLTRGLGGLGHDRDGRFEHLTVQTELVAEVVVHGRDVGAGFAADRANRHFLEAVRCELSNGDVEHAPVSPAVRVAASPTHSVLLNMRVASVIAMTENTSRYARSNPIASKPVFFSSRHLKACTEYVNGSTTAMACIHCGNPCCGYTAPLGKYSSVLSTPKIARGTSGSVTRTMIRNIKLISENAVMTMTMKRRSNRSGANGSGIPAITEPMIIRKPPAITALIVPDRLNPATSSSFVIGVTR